MKQSLPPSVVVGFIVVAVIVIGLIGWHFISGGPNANVNSETLNYYQHGAKHSTVQNGPHNGPPAQAAPNTGG